MGMENNVMVSYLEDNERFADIFNFSCFEGLQIVQTDDLEDDSTMYHTSLASTSVAESNSSSRQEDTAGQKNATKLKSAAKQRDATKPKSTMKQIDPERARDVKKRLHTGQSLKILAIESQSDINYLMPWRCMDYDSREYGKQIHKIKRRHEQETKAGIKIGKRTNGEYLSKFNADDRLNPAYTICVYHGTAPWDGPRNLDEETAGAISHMIGIKNFTVNKDEYKSNEGGYNMCQAMREIIEDSKNEGFEAGRANTIIIVKYLQANPTATNEDISSACECRLEDVVAVRTALSI